MKFNSDFLLAIFTLLLMLVGSCDTKKINTDIPVYNIDLEKTKSVSDSFVDWSVICLETNDSILIANIDDVQFSDTTLFVIDKKNAIVYHFDSKGKFINMINRQGGGPEEYISISDCKIIDENIYILSSVKRTIYKYNMDGKFVKSYKFNSYYHYFDFLNPNLIVLYSAFSNDEMFNFQIYDIEKQAITKSFSPFKFNENFVISESPFANDNSNSLLVTLPYDYTLFKMDESSFESSCCLNFNSKDKLPEEYKSFDKLREELLTKQVVTSLDLVFYSNDHLFVTYVYNYQTHISSIDLNTGNTNTVVLQSDQKYPFCFANPLAFYKNQLVSYLPAYVVLQFDNNFLSDKNESGNLNADDNPVLFFHKLKF